MKTIHVVSLMSILGLMALTDLHSQEKYSKIRIPLASRADAVRIHSLGVALDDARGRPGKWMDVFVSASQLMVLERNGVSYTTLIDDWDSYYADRLAKDLQTSVTPTRALQVTHFHLGSMGGCLTFPEVLTELDSMRHAYPGLISIRDSIGASIEGRAIWAVKISKNPDVDESEPRALYTGVHHAREGGGMMAVIYFMWYLLEQYGTNQEVTDLLDTRELFFIPVVNPDGYEFNRATNPSGGGMWRKNRRLNPLGSYGVDINRNYGFEWGHDDNGSSSNELYEDYRGANAFSEPETRAVRDFCVAKHPNIALNYHTFGSLLVRPWGYTDSETGDSIAYWDMSDELTRTNRYAAGLGTGTVGYTTNGDSDDWMYGDTLMKPRLLSWTPEIGNDVDGFWAVPSRILPLAMENLDANLRLAHAAGPWVGISDPPAVAESLPDTIKVNLGFTNKGRVLCTSAINVSVLSNDVQILSGQASSFAWTGGQQLQVLARRSAYWYPGQVVRLGVMLTYPGGSTLDTVSFRLGPVIVLYADDAENSRSHWTSEATFGTGWDTTSARAHSGRRSFTDSPNGNYPDNQDAYFVLDSTFVLNGSGAELRFWTRWQMESEFDFGTVEISSDDWVSSTTLAGRYTGPGSGQYLQPVQSQGYDGQQPRWVEEVMDLGGYLGVTPRRFGFRLQSDAGVNFDGMYVDDIRILLYPFGGDAVRDLPERPRSFVLEQNYPNPFNPTTSIRYSIPVETYYITSLRVYDLLGREVAVLVDERKAPGIYAVQFDGSNLASGVYFYRLTSGDFVATKRLVLLK